MIDQQEHRGALTAVEGLDLRSGDAHRGARREAGGHVGVEGARAVLHQAIAHQLRAHRLAEVEDVEVGQIVAQQRHRDGLGRLVPAAALFAAAAAVALRLLFAAPDAQLVFLRHVEPGWLAQQQHQHAPQEEQGHREQPPRAAGAQQQQGGQRHRGDAEHREHRLRLDAVRPRPVAQEAGLVNAQVPVLGEGVSHRDHHDAQLHHRDDAPA